MTKSQLKRSFYFYCGILLVICVAAFSAAPFLAEHHQKILPQTMTGLGLIATAWIGYCFQQRIAFSKNLVDVWKHMVESVQAAIHYAECREAPTEAQHAKVRLQLSTSIDLTRGVFQNLKKKGSKAGLYPFESLKEIYELLSELGWGKDFEKADRDEYRSHIFELWKNVREPFLQELDLAYPDSYDSPYLTPSDRAAKLSVRSYVRSVGTN